MELGELSESQSNGEVPKWESLYSPKLKYGSYRSRDLKLRHRERCVRVWDRDAKFTARDHVALIKYSQG